MQDKVYSRTEQSNYQVRLLRKTVRAVAMRTQRPHSRRMQPEQPTLIR